jgi:large repetitive protein
VTDGGNATCTITNDDKPGTLIVKKELATDDGALTSCDDFSFTVNGGDAIAFEDDCKNKLTVDAGTYTVVETDADGYSTSYENCSAVAIANGGKATCTISNDDKPASLIVKKVVAGGDLDCEDFSFTVNGGDAITFDDDCENKLTVDAGTYTIVETDADGYTTTYDNCSQVAIANDGEATCTITNTRQTGTIEVVKDLDPADDPGRFDLLINGEAEAEDVGDGGSTGAVTVDTGGNTVGEAAGTGTSLGNYSSSIECRADDGEGEVVASGAGAGPLQLDVAHEDEILCVITNERVSVGIVKTNDAGEAQTVEPGETIGFTLTVTVSGGTATNVVVTDELPDGLTYVNGSASPAGADVDGQSLTWELDSLAEGSHAFTYDATVDADASGDLTNLGCVDADQNHDLIVFELFDDDEEDLVCSTTTVHVQDAKVTKTNGTMGPVARGTDVTFTLTIDVTNGPIDAITIDDELPDGLAVTDETTISDGGSYSALTNTITWHLVNVADGESLTYEATVTADAIAGEHVNVATITDGPCTGDCDDDSTVTVLPPTLTVEKVADAEQITISGPNDALVASPSIVAWTLSYTLTNGPAANVVISDEIPTGFTFLDATDGGTFAGGTVTWTFPTLTESGSVSFRTTVDPETISRTGPTENVAVIDSDDTDPDEGEDSVTVSVEPPPLGGNPTPTPSLPDTAIGIGIDGQTVSVPLELLVIALIGSLGALTIANVRSWSRRR